MTARHNPTVTITINNVAQNVSGHGGPYTVSGRQFDAVASTTDPAVADPLTYGYRM